MSWNGQAGLCCTGHHRDETSRCCRRCPMTPKAKPLVLHMPRSVPAPRVSAEELYWRAVGRA